MLLDIMDTIRQQNRLELRLCIGFWTLMDFINLKDGARAGIEPARCCHRGILSSTHSAYELLLALTFSDYLFY